jgi:hypothetical protein
MLFLVLKLGDLASPLDRLGAGIWSKKNASTVLSVFKQSITVSLAVCCLPSFPGRMLPSLFLPSSPRFSRRLKRQGRASFHQASSEKLYWGSG